jgi:hypothetical protein
MSDTGLGGVDFSLGLEEMGADLLAYFQTAEGQASLAESGFETPVIPDEAIPDATPPAGGGPTPPDGGPTPPDDDDETDEEDDALAVAMQQELEFQQAQLEAATKRRKEDARVTMANVLNTYGLGELSDYIYNEIIVKETVNLNNPDAIIFAIREQPAYKKRFAGNAARLKKGLAELDPASYIGLENQYRETLRANGLPANFYDQSEDFQSLIEGDVSNSELNERVQQGYRAVADADPAVKEQMKNLYGVSEGQ